MPAVGEAEVLVRVHAASVNPADWHVIRVPHPETGPDTAARLAGRSRDRRPPGAATHAAMDSSQPG